MLIEELLRRGNDGTTGKMATSLYRFAQTVAEKAKEHAKRILAQLPEFDLHDEIHLSAVLGNLEQIIGADTTSKLSVYELFFLHAASQLHDVGMALPDWELNAIVAVEAENKPDGGSWHEEFSTNGGRPLSFSAARELVLRHAENLYRSFDAVGEWLRRIQRPILLIISRKRSSNIRSSGVASQRRWDRFRGRNCTVMCGRFGSIFCEERTTYVRTIMSRL